MGQSGPKEGQVLRMQALFLQVKSQRLHRARSHRAAGRGLEAAPAIVPPPAQLLHISGHHGGPEKT